MTKWIVLLLLAIVGLAILGFVIDVAEGLVGLAIVVLLVIAGWQFWKRRSRA